MIELTQKRTKNSKTYDLGAGKRRLISTIHAQHYLEGQEYLDTDTYLVAKNEVVDGEEFSHYCNKAPFEVRLNRYKQPLFFKDKKSGDIVLVRPIGAASVAGNKTGNIVYYPSVYPGLDIRRTVTPEGLKEEIIKVGADIPDYLEFQVQGDFDKYARTPFVIIDNEKIDFPYNAEGDRRILSLIKLRDMPIGTPVDPSLSVQVSASTDDCRRRLTDSAWSTGVSNVIVGRSDASDKQYGGGARFLNVTISQGATITSAIFRLVCSGSDSPTPVYSRLSCENTDNPATFSTAEDFDARWASRTTAIVDWDNIPAWTLNQTYDSPNISSCVQEVTDRPGWASAIVVFWEDFDDRTSLNYRQRYAYSWNGNPFKAPQLVVDYTEPGGLIERSRRGIGRGILRGI